MICPVCTRDPCICQSRHWNHWVESDTIEKFDAFVKSLQKNPGLVQRDYELCNEVGLPIDPVDRERRAGVVVLSQKARQAQATFQYQVLGGGFPRDGVPLLHSGLVCDEELIYPRTTGKTMTGIGSLMDGLRAKRKKQHNRKFWVDKQQPAWAGGRKRGKR